MKKLLPPLMLLAALLSILWFFVPDLEKAWKEENSEQKNEEVVEEKEWYKITVSCKQPGIKEKLEETFILNVVPRVHNGTHFAFYQNGLLQRVFIQGDLCTMFSERYYND